MKFSRRIPGPSHEVSSQSVVTRDWLGSFRTIDGPSWPYDGSVGVSLDNYLIQVKLKIVGIFFSLLSQVYCLFTF